MRYSTSTSDIISNAETILSAVDWHDRGDDRTDGQGGSKDGYNRRIDDEVRSMNEVVAADVVNLSNQLKLQQLQKYANN